MLNPYGILLNHVYMVKKDNQLGAAAGICYQVSGFANKIVTDDRITIAHEVKMDRFGYRRTSVDRCFTESEFIANFEAIKELDLTAELYEAMRLKGYETKHLVYSTKRDDEVINEVGIFPRKDV